LGLASVVISVTLFNLIPTLLRRAIDGLRSGVPASVIWTIAAEMVGITLVMAVFRFLMRETINGVSRHIETDLRDALFAHLTHLDAAWFGRTRTGEIMARLTNDLGAVRMAAGPAIMYLTNTVFGALMALVFMSRISLTLTGLAILPMIGLPFVMLRLGKVVHDRFEAVQAHFGDLTTMTQENLSGVRIVRAYGQEPAEMRRFDAMSTEYVRRNVSLARLYGLMNPSFGLLAGLGATAVLGFGGTLVLEGKITVGAFVAFGFYLSNLTWPLIALGWVTNLFQRGSASMARLNELFDAVPAVVGPVHPVSLPATTGGRTIEFRKVGFGYPTGATTNGRTANGVVGNGRTANGDTATDRTANSETARRPVLTDVSFVIPAGGTLGIVGATGSGKSALLELIPRLYDVTAGEILIDGVPLPTLDLAAWRAEIGFVPQESLLFSDTILTNLTYGGTSDADARWAAGIAQLTETIDALPSGAATMLGERGINLSGGQKQRAAMARALARKPSVVILDDALSAVDTHTEAAILRGLRSALSGRTAIIASHRITAIREATHIIVLDDGRVVESGTHETLMALRGTYFRLLDRQQLEEAVDAA
jgi:ATP-binding cassette subfamily B protein